MAKRQEILRAMRIVLLAPGIGAAQSFCRQRGLRRIGNATADRRRWKGRDHRIRFLRLALTCPAFFGPRVYCGQDAPEREKARYGEDQMVRILREADRMPVAQVAGQYGVSEAKIAAAAENG